MTSTKFSFWRLLDWTLHPPLGGPPATLLLRLMAGGVFFWEGILKFVYANQGVGRFTKLGMPFPTVLAPTIGSLEIVGGLLLMLGLLTRFIALPMVIEMVVAMLSTKISLFLGTYPLPPPSSPPTVGMWAVLHEIRSEYAQLMVCLFLIAAGPGRYSLDALLSRTRRREAARPSRSALEDLDEPARSVDADALARLDALHR
jgi:uncharacterized membrane protein YphA (DoxX/SURF4 family)